MSDPVTNVEIEDVLSSIRKLVADDKRTSAPPKRPVPDRLVLTPAQRIQEPAEDTSDDAKPDTPVLLTDPVAKEPAPEKRLDTRSMDGIPGDARLAEFGDVEGLFPDLDDVDRSASARDAADPDDADRAEERERLDLGRLIEEEVAAALGNTGAERQDNSAEDGRTHADHEENAWLDDLPEDWESEDVAASGESRDSEDHRPVEEADASEIAVEPIIAAKPTPQTLEDKVAALGRLVARGSNDFEEERDAAEDDEIAAVTEPMTWPDAAPFDEMVEPEEPEVGSNVVRSDGLWPEPEDRDEEVPAAAPIPATPASPQEARSELQLDEDVLREMVVDIVRSELQGAMGERITRNVRKLVRREIHRMLISQELD